MGCSPELPPSPPLSVCGGEERERGTKVRSWRRRAAQRRAYGHRSPGRTGRNPAKRRGGRPAYARLELHRVPAVVPPGRAEHGEGEERLAEPIEGPGGRHMEGLNIERGREWRERESEREEEREPAPRDSSSPV